MISTILSPSAQNHPELKGKVIPPVIITVNKFDDDSAKLFREQFNLASNTGQTIIPIVIDSYGGYCYSLLSMIDCITSSKIKVITVTEGKAMSCGLFLFSCGEERYIGPNATLMIHEVSSMEWGKVEEIKSSTEETVRLNTLLLETLAKNTGKHKRYFLDIIHEKSHADWYLTPKEALSHDIATKIGTPSLITTVSVNYSLGEI